MNQKIRLLGCVKIDAYYMPGDVIDIEQDEAERLIAAGVAVAEKQSDKANKLSEADQPTKIGKGGK